MDRVADEVRASLTSHPLVIHDRWLIPLPAAPNGRENILNYNFHAKLFYVCVYGDKLLPLRTMSVVEFELLARTVQDF